MITDIAASVGQCENFTMTTTSSKRRWIQSEDDYLRAMADKKVSVDIANALGRSRASIRLRAQRIGISLTHWNQHLSSDASRHKCDDHFFSVLDSDAKAYWAGFILADGCVHRGRFVSVFQSVRDIALIRQFKADANSESSVSVSSKNGKQYCSLIINSRQMFIQSQ